MAKTAVTISIVSYKSPELSVNALKAVFEETQRYPNLAIKAVVVDNASGDTPEIAEAIDKNGWSDWATILTAPKNGGFGYGNNYAFKYALDNWHVDYFHMLNPDTEVRAGGIKALVDFLEATPKAGAAGSSFETSDGEAWPYAFRFPGLMSEFESAVNFGPVTKLLQRYKVGMTMGADNQRVDWLSGASMMMRADVIKAMRGFDESYFLYFEETDLFLRMAQAGYESWYVPSSRVMHILGQSTKVTEITDQPKRLPAYWFESRTHYFYKHHGLLKTMLIDAGVVIGSGLNLIKRLPKQYLLNKREDVTPYFVRDLLSNSVWHGRNRKRKPFISPL